MVSFSPSHSVRGPIVKIPADPFPALVFLAVLGGATLGALAVAHSRSKNGKASPGLPSSFAARSRPEGGALERMDEEEWIAMFI